MGEAKLTIFLDGGLKRLDVCTPTVGRTALRTAVAEVVLEATVLQVVLNGPAFRWCSCLASKFATCLRLSLMWGKILSGPKGPRIFQPPHKR